MCLLFFLQNVTSLLKTIIQDFKNAYSNTASTDEDEVQLIRETAHFTTTAFEDFVVRFAKEQLSDANPQSNVTDRVGECNLIPGFSQVLGKISDFVPQSLAY